MKREIVMVLLLVAGLDSAVPPTIDLAAVCDGVPAGDQRCGSCLQPVQCQTPNPPVELNTCRLGTVCEQILPTEASCVSIALATACQCTSDRCDYYDPQFSVKCDASGITDVVDCTAAEQCVGNGICSTCAGTPGTEYFFIDQKCSSMYRCTGGVYAGVVNCADGQYVSKGGTCSQAPPTPCAAADKCTAGLCPDLTDCSRYYSCDPNQVPPATGPISCPSNQYFNPDTLLCESTSVNCDRWTQCDFTSVDGGTTSTSKTTASPYSPPESCDANSVGNFPYGPCDPRYWACRHGSESYEVIEMQCPNGLVFSTDLTNPYCIDPSNEPTCSTYAAEQ